MKMSSKTLNVLKNYANIMCKNSETRNGAEVNIKWKNEDLLKI